MQETPIKQPDEMFCHSCGSVIKREAEICVKCGVRARRAPSLAPGLAGTGAKSKVAAVLLAIFLGFWTWLYTYREDGVKFWIALGASVGNVLLLILTLGLWIFFFWIPIFGLWIWPVIDAATKSDDWYASY